MQHYHVEAGTGSTVKVRMGPYWWMEAMRASANYATGVIEECRSMDHNTCLSMVGVWELRFRPGHVDGWVRVIACEEEHQDEALLVEL